MSKLLERINFPTVIRILTFTAYPAGLVGMAAFAFQAGPIYLFPYRLLIPLMWIMFLGWVVQSRGKLRLPPLQVKTFGIFLVIWLVYSFISVNWAVDQSSAIKHVVFLLYAFSLIFFSVISFDKPEQLMTLSLIWIILLVLTSFLGLVERFTGFHLPISLNYQTGKTSFRFIPTAVFYNPNDFATFLALSAPFLISAVLFLRKWFFRLAGLLFLGILFFLLAATNSRSNMMAVFLEMIFFAFVAYAFLRTRREFYWTAGLLLIVPLFFPSRVLDSLNSVWNVLQQLAVGFSGTIGSLSIRMNLVRNGIHFLVSTAGFGVGAGNVERWMATRAIYEIGYLTNMHNWFLEVLVNFGVLIFAGYMLFYLGMIYQTYLILQVHWQDIRMRFLGVIVMGSLIGFLFASMSSSSIIALTPHWMVFAFGLSYLNIGSNLNQKYMPESGQRAVGKGPDVMGSLLWSERER